MHLTLQFLGHLPAVKLPPLKAGLQVPFEPFELGSGMPEVWNQGVAVVRPVMIPAGLQNLHALLDAALLRLGIHSVRGTSRRTSRWRGTRPGWCRPQSRYRSAGGWIITCSCAQS